MAIDKETLLKQRFGEQEVQIPGVAVVRVRALTRGEALQVRDKTMGTAEIERKLLAWALVEPKLTEDDVRAWQDASPAGELEVVVDAIVKLSGMEKAAAKAAYREFRG
ncbi:MAG: hypothetical protein L0H64_23225 [Pseudonocardia sp.]|nr:hypothetical protein [Pseudonocardia sp.]